MRTKDAPSRLHRVRRWLVRFGVLLVVAILAAVALLYFRQHDMIYHPRPYRGELAHSLPPGVLDLRYQTIAGNQVAFYLARGSGTGVPARIWVAFGGNGSLALEWLGLIERDPNPQNAFLLVEYPGYGRSEGYATIATNRAAAEGALGALGKQLGAEAAELESRLNVIGHSFGTAVALDFSTRHNVQRVVLVSPFTTLREEGALVVGGLLSYLLIENYDNRARLRELTEKTAPPRIGIFHGTNDDIIPVHMGRELAVAHLTMVHFFPIEGGDHLSPLFHNADQILARMNE